ncbi:HEAT repeat domain-containing protein [Pseudozobellia sp. WGM2]|uniref:HEAT repeat domain-containing protein n=1 Tax=Pseudozobellia sp. WGM2 TaxID=2787625 RepID=UPI001AE07728|nr:HEAT repeat domain-containing protein [Pseudozobellia sp. WGM2]
MLIASIKYKMPPLITAPRIDIDLLWMLTFVFIGLAVIYLISVFVFRNNISSTSAKTKNRKKELSPMVSEFLFYDENSDKSEKSNYIDLKIQIRELIKDKFNRKVLTEVLLDLRKDVSGDTKQRLFKLYQDLGLEKDAFDKLDSWRWEVVSKGISQLTQMHVEPAYGFITKFINDRRSTVRKQAEIATVTLKSEGINYFLDTTRYKISEWQQLKLLDVLRNREAFDPPRFKFWLTSTNKHVVLFALRLIKYYNQNDANTSLIELVKHKNNHIKLEAIGCIKEFYVVEALPVLKQVLAKCNVDIKIAILDVIGELGEEKDIDFLNSVAQREGNFAVKSKAMAAMNMIVPETVMPTEGIDNRGIEIEEVQIQKQITEPIVEISENGSVENSVESDIDIFINTSNEQEVLPEEKETMGETPKPIEDDSDPIVQETNKIHNEEEAHNTEVKEEQVDLETCEILDVNEDVSADATIESQSLFDNLAAFVANEIPLTEKLSEEVLPNISFLSVQGEAEKPCETVENLFKIKSHIDADAVLASTKAQPPLYIEFLPLVILNNGKKHPQPKNVNTMKDSKAPDPGILKMEVEFEEVKVPIVYDSKKEPPLFDIQKIGFLPVVTEGEEKQEFGPDVDDCRLVSDIEELGFLPIVTDAERKIEDVGANDESGESDVIEELEGFVLNDFEVDFERTENTVSQENIEFELDDEAFVNVDGEGYGEDVITWLLTQNGVEEIEVEFEEVSKDSENIEDLIPEPVYYNEHEAYMMGLLDDLEEMGDHREIALLEELLEAENKGFIKDRILHMIEIFSKQRDGHIALRKSHIEELDLPSFSVFADLFKSIDRESKLILLEEIVIVGDEKEIQFLDGLLEDPDTEIRIKAQSALKLLVAKVAENEETKKDKKKEDDTKLTKALFDDQMAKENPEVQYTEDEFHQLLNEVDIEPSLDPEIFDIDFELSEVLDKTYDKEVLNLPVIATEVSPNGASFLFQLYNFPKNIFGKLNG